MKSYLSGSFANLLSHYRLILMGLAMICIILYHQSWVSVGIFKYINILGYIGVEIFLLLSGFGIAHSLSKNSLATFYKHRIYRLLPASFIYGTIKVTLSILPFFPDRSCALLLDLFSLSHWYIYAIIVYYFIAPLFYKLVNRFGYCILILVSFVSYIIVYFWPNNIEAPYFIYYGRWIVKRLPIFILGMTIACRPISIKSAVLIGLPSLIINLIFFRYIILFNAHPETLSIPERWFIWFPNRADVPDQGRYLLDMLSTFIIVPIFVLLGEIINKVKLLNIVKWVGIFSLELYLCHQFVFKIVSSLLDYYPLGEFVIAIVICIVLSIIIKFAASMIQSKLYDMEAMLGR